MASPLEHDETRFGDRFRKLLLVLDGDDRVQLTRQDQCRAADPSDLLDEIEPSDLISPEMNADVFAKDRSREDVRISFRRVVVGRQRRRYSSPLAGFGSSNQRAATSLISGPPRRSNIANARSCRMRAALLETISRAGSSG
jgi:hypothetical protein